MLKGQLHINRRATVEFPVSVSQTVLLAIEGELFADVMHWKKFQI